MNYWFECKVKFDHTGNDGMIKSVSQVYLVEAISFTDAESIVIKEAQPYTSGEFEVVNIKRVKVGDLFEHAGSDKWYRCKVNYISLDEEKQVEKKMAQIIIIQASTLRDAVNALYEDMRGTLGDWEVVNVTETPIIDVLRFTVKNG